MRSSYLRVGGDDNEMVINMQYETISWVLLMKPPEKTKTEAERRTKSSPKKESLMTVTACDCTCTIAISRYIFLCTLFFRRTEN